MTVYVDDMYLSPMGQFKRMKISHMIADSLEELHTMANKLGLRRSWFQGDHYDVSMGVRSAAILHGVVPITLRQCSAMSLERGRDPTKKLCSPVDAEAWLAARSVQ